MMLFAVFLFTLLFVAVILIFSVITVGLYIVIPPKLLLQPFYGSLIPTKRLLVSENITKEQVSKQSQCSVVS